MKTLTIMAYLVLLSAGAAFAQSESTGSANNSVSGTESSANQITAHDVTGFSNSHSGPAYATSSKRNNLPPNMHPNLAPRPGGIVSDTVRYGAILYSPTAPAEYGNGEKYLSAPSPRYDVDHQPAFSAHRDSGGFKLFSLEF